jgi:hypothetical protein
MEEEGQEQHWSDESYGDHLYENSGEDGNRAMYHA